MLRQTMVCKVMKRGKTRVGGENLFSLLEGSRTIRYRMKVLFINANNDKGKMMV